MMRIDSLKIPGGARQEVSPHQKVHAKGTSPICKSARERYVPNLHLVKRFNWLGGGVGAYFDGLIGFLQHGEGIETWRVFTIRCPFRLISDD